LVKAKSPDQKVLFITLGTPIPSNYQKLATPKKIPVSQSFYSYLRKIGCSFSC
jgi:hypothetical protein